MESYNWLKNLSSNSFLENKGVFLFTEGPCDGFCPTGGGPVGGCGTFWDDFKYSTNVFSNWSTGIPFT